MFSRSVLKLYITYGLPVLLRTKQQKKSVYVIIFVVLFTKTDKAVYLDGMPAHE